jgi:hypothetical protein
MYREGAGACRFRIANRDEAALGIRFVQSAPEMMLEGRFGAIHPKPFPCSAILNSLLSDSEFPVIRF